MFTILQLFKSFLSQFASRSDRDDAYLAGAVDACDLEYRLRAIDERDRDPMSGIAIGLYPR
jgi:hypothetical protein